MRIVNIVLMRNYFMETSERQKDFVLKKLIFKS